MNQHVIDWLIWSYNIGWSLVPRFATKPEHGGVRCHPDKVRDLFKALDLLEAGIRREEATP